MAQQGQGDMISNSSPSQASTPSPNKGTSVKDFSRERLEKLFTDSIRKLKAKDKQLLEVTAERDTLAKQLSSGEVGVNASETADLQSQLKAQIEGNEKLQSQLKEAAAKLSAQEDLLEQCQQEFTSRLEDSKQQSGMLEEQVTALKGQIRNMAENKDSEARSAAEALKQKLHEVTHKATRTESIARAARANASKAQAECQVLEGALEGAKAMLTKAENEKLALEAQIQQLMVDAERSDAEHKKRHDDLTKQLHQSSLSPKSPSPKSPTEANEAAKEEIAALRAEISSKWEHWKAREAELIREVEDLRLHAVTREKEVSEKVSEAERQVDLLLPELESAKSAAEDGASRSAEDLSQARRALAEQNLAMQDLEDRMAQTESALNVAHTQLEEQSMTTMSASNPLSPKSQSSPRSPGKSQHNSDLLLEPELPDIKDRRSFSSRQLSEEEQNDRIEKLESYVEQLEEEIEALRKLKDELAEVKAEKERVENAVRTYLAEKPAEDALRDKELQKAQAETAEVQEALDEAIAQRDVLQERVIELQRLQTVPHETISDENHSPNTGDASQPQQEASRDKSDAPEISSQPNKSGDAANASSEEETSSLRAQIQTLTQRCADLEAKIEIRESELQKREAQIAEREHLDSENQDEHARVKGELQRARMQLDKQREELRSLQASATANEDAENTITDLRQQLQTTQQKEADLSEKVQELEIAVAQGRQTKQATEEQSAESVGKRDSGQHLEEERQKTARLESKLEVLGQQLKSTQESLHTAESRLQEKQNALQIAKNQQQEISELLSKLQSTEEEHVSKIESLNSQIENLERADTTRKDTIEQLERELKSASNRIEELELKIASSSERETHHLNSMEKLTSEAKLRSEELANLRREHDSKLEELQAAKDELQAVKNSLEELQSGTVGAEELTAAKNEIAQLTESLEAAKSNLAKEKERAHRFIVDLKKRLEKSNKELKQAEAEQKALKAAENDFKQQLESKYGAERDEMVASQRALEVREAESSEHAKKCEDELNSYKARAHALLKSKDLELKGAKEAAESAIAKELEEAKASAQTAQEELRKVREELEEANSAHEEKLHSMEQRLEQSASDLRDALDESQTSAEAHTQAIEHWRRRYEALEGRLESLRSDRRQAREGPTHLVQKHAEELNSVNERHRALQEEFATFKESSQQIAEARERELDRVLGLNASLRDELSLLRNRRDSHVMGDDDDRQDWNFNRLNSRVADDRASFYSAGSQAASGSFANNLGMLSRHGDYTRQFQDESWNFSEGRAPSDWAFIQEANPDLMSARVAEQQAQKEEELKLAKKQAKELETEIADLSREVELRQEQEQVLKEALREAEREKGRIALADNQRLDIEYLKNTVLKLYETGQAHVLLPAISTLLHFSPAEMQRCKDGLAKQAELFSDASGALETPQPAAQSGLLGGWTSWAFGESEPS